MGISDIEIEKVHNAPFPNPVREISCGPSEYHGQGIDIRESLSSFFCAIEENSSHGEQGEADEKCLMHALFCSGKQAKDNACIADRDNPEKMGNELYARKEIEPGLDKKL